MPTVKLVFPDGGVKEVEAEKISVKEAREAWSEFLLEDGSLVRVKPVLARALRTSEFDPSGNPIYQFMVSQAVFVEAAEELKKSKD